MLSLVIGFILVMVGLTGMLVGVLALPVGIPFMPFCILILIIGSGLIDRSSK